MATTRQPQCQKPRGFPGRLVLRLMNARHSGVTDWGLSHISIGKQSIILDAGCGGGRTVSKLAALATEGKVYGIDFSSESVAFAKRLNRDWIAAGRVEIHEASISQLPFPDAMFDLVTAVETHFWWPDLASDMREVFRVVKPGGTLGVVAEVYKGSGTAVSKLAEKNLPKMGMKLLTADEHRDLLTGAGFADVRVITKPNGWICAAGKKT